MSFLGIKTRSDYKREAETLSTSLMIIDGINKINKQTIEWFENTVNKIIFNTDETKLFSKDSALLVIDNIGPDLKDNNATFYCGVENTYIYLSKKLSEGYTHLYIGYRGGKIKFMLNNDGIGLEIDSNNRVKDRAIMLYLKEYFGVKDDKIEIFFTKI